MQRAWRGGDAGTPPASTFREVPVQNFLMPPHPRSYKAYFVDLFVRCSNTVAIRMYSKLGYSVYRWVGAARRTGERVLRRGKVGSLNGGRWPRG
jgi:hypothetical protein